MANKKPHQRVNDILLGPLERPALRWLAESLPLWINPDILTAIGIVGSIVIFASYALTNLNNAFLWLASVGFIINWFGDSLDGTVARHRKIERPKYGFFVDHTVDAFSQLLIFAGLGLSPFVSFHTALLALSGYLLMTVLVYVDTYVTGVFKISYGKFGPTEMRLIAILTNIGFFYLGIPEIDLPWGTAVVYDLFVGAIGIAMISIFAWSAFKRAMELARAGE